MRTLASVPKRRSGWSSCTTPRGGCHAANPSVLEDLSVLTEQHCLRPHSRHRLLGPFSGNATACGRGPLLCTAALRTRPPPTASRHALNRSPVASPASWLPTGPCTAIAAFVGRGPGLTTAAPQSAHHGARCLPRRRRHARSSMSPTLFAPPLETLPLAVVAQPLRIGVALGALRPRATSRTRAGSRSHPSASEPRLGPNSHRSGTPDARGSPTTSLATSRSNPQWPRSLAFANPRSDSCGAPNDWR